MRSQEIRNVDRQSRKSRKSKVCKTLTRMKEYYMITNLLKWYCNSDRRGSLLLRNAGPSAELQQEKSKSKTATDVEEIPKVWRPVLESWWCLRHLRLREQALQHARNDRHTLQLVRQLPLQKRRLVNRWAIVKRCIITTISKFLNCQ